MWHPLSTESTTGRFLKGRESYSRKLPPLCFAGKWGLWTHYFNLESCQSLSMGSLILLSSFQAHYESSPQLALWCWAQELEAFSNLEDASFSYPKCVWLMKDARIHIPSQDIPSRGAGWFWTSQPCTVKMFWIVKFRPPRKAPLCYMVP